MRAFGAAWLCALLLAGTFPVHCEGDRTGGAGRAVPPATEPLFPYDGALYVPPAPTLACKQVVDQDGDAVTYEFCLDDQNDFSSPLFTASPSSANDTSFSIGTDWAGSLSSNTTYYWRARSRDASGPSPWSQTWRFRADGATFTFDDVVAGVSNGTEQAYWNYTDVVWRSFAHANGVFAENGLKVWFSVSEIYRYYGEDWPEAQTWEGHGRDLVVLFDEGSGFGGYLSIGWYIIGQSFLWGSSGIASEAGMDALMHEIGHYRGVRDLYLYNVAPEDNGVVPGMGHRYTDKNQPDLMDYPYWVHKMQNFTRALINQTGNSTRADTDFDIWHGAFCPERNYILVKDKKGAPIPWADVSVYASRPYQNLTGGFAFGSSFDSIPEKSGSTGADGAFLFGEKSGGKLDFAFDLCFVSVTFNNTTEYAFLESVETGGLFWGFMEAPILLNGSAFDVFYSDGAPPGPPQRFAALPGNGYADLTWDPPVGDGRYPATGYRIYRGTESGNETLYASLGNVTSFRDPALAPLQRYYYRASSVNEIGEGQKGIRVSAVSTLSRPGIPQNLRALPGDGRARLEWEAPASDGGSPVTGYRIFRGAASEDRRLLAETGNLTTYEDRGLANGVMYRYTVSALNTAGQSGDSIEASVIPAALPGAPRDLRATAGDGRITLEWTEPLSDGGLAITNYLVYRGVAPGATSLFKEIEDIGTNIFEDSGLSNGKTYYYNITARSGAGEGASSEEASATPLTRPSAPRDLRATDGDGRARLVWKAPEQDGGAPILKYRLYRGEEPGEWPFLRDIEKGLEFSDAGLSNGKVYYYRVSAFNRAGEGPLSDEARAAPAAVPSAPRDLKAVAGDGRVSLSWKAPDSDGGAAITNYSIFRGSMAGAEVFLQEAGNEHSFTDTGLANGRPYYYIVKAKNRMGEGPFSAEVSALPAAPPPVKYRLGGRVLVQGTGQPIPGAILSLAGGNSTIANQDGAYSFLLEGGNYSITASAAGYAPSTVNITLARADLTKDLYLSKAAAGGGRGPPTAPANWLWPAAPLVVVIALAAVALVIGLRRRGRAAG